MASNEKALCLICGSHSGWQEFRKRKMIKFFPLPMGESEDQLFRRELWLEQIKSVYNKPFPQTEETRLCSLHFVNVDPFSEDSVPNQMEVDDIWKIYRRKPAFAYQNRKDKPRAELTPKKQKPQALVEETYGPLPEPTASALVLMCGNGLKTLGSVITELLNGMSTDSSVPEINLTITGSDPQLRANFNQLESLRDGWNKTSVADVINLLLVKQLCSMLSPGYVEPQNNTSSVCPEMAVLLDAVDQQETNVSVASLMHKNGDFESTYEQRSNLSRLPDHILQTDDACLNRREKSFFDRIKEGFENSKAATSAQEYMDNESGMDLFMDYAEEESDSEIGLAEYQMSPQPLKSRKSLKSKVKSPSERKRRSSKKRFGSKTKHVQSDYVTQDTNDINASVPSDARTDDFGNNTDMPAPAIAENSDVKYIVSEEKNNPITENTQCCTSVENISYMGKETTAYCCKTCGLAYVKLKDFLLHMQMKHSGMPVVSPPEKHKVMTNKPPNYERVSLLKKRPDQPHTTGISTSAANENNSEVVKSHWHNPDVHDSHLNEGVVVNMAVHDLSIQEVSRPEKQQIINKKSPNNEFISILKKMPVQPHSTGISLSTVNENKIEAVKTDGHNSDVQDSSVNVGEVAAVAEVSRREKHQIVNNKPPNTERVSLLKKMPVQIVKNKPPNTERVSLLKKKPVQPPTIRKSTRIANVNNSKAMNTNGHNPDVHDSSVNVGEVEFIADHEHSGTQEVSRHERHQITKIKTLPNTERISFLKKMPVQIMINQPPNNEVVSLLKKQPVELPTTGKSTRTKNVINSKAVKTGGHNSDVHDSHLNEGKVAVNMSVHDLSNESDSLTPEVTCAHPPEEGDVPHPQSEAQSPATPDSNGGTISETISSVEKSTQDNKKPAGDLSKVYWCNVCNIYVKSLVAMQYHMTKVHPTIVSEFEEKRAQARSLARERNTPPLVGIEGLANPNPAVKKKMHKCGHCELYFNTRHLRYVHTRRVHPAVINKPVRESKGGINRIVSCKYCHKEFKKRNYKSHLAHKHFKGTPFTCHICPRTFKVFKALTAHLRSHEEGELSCDICGKTFHGKFKLGLHKKRHFDNKVYPCPKCGKKLTTPQGLRTHLLYHEEVKKFVCEICGKGCITASSLSIHRASHLRKQHEREESSTVTISMLPA